MLRMPNRRRRVIKAEFEAASRGVFVPAPVQLRYRAFLSYANADARWARWLHGKLEGFRIDKDLVGRKTEVGADAEDAAADLP